MIFDKMVSQNDILARSMQAAILKNEVIQNNIANVDTPGFKKKTVVFDELLSNELESAKRLKTLDLDKVQPKVKIHHSSFKYRLDENNVDVETEMVDLYQNSVRYDTMASSVMNNYKRINLVLSAK